MEDHLWNSQKTERERERGRRKAVSQPLCKYVSRKCLKCASLGFIILFHPLRNGIKCLRNNHNHWVDFLVRKITPKINQLKNLIVKKKKTTWCATVLVHCNCSLLKWPLANSTATLFGRHELNWSSP